MRNLARPAPRRRRRVRFGRESRCWTTELDRQLASDPRICAGPGTRPSWSLNPLARALNPYSHQVVNLLRAVFLEPSSKAWCPDWERVCAILCSWLRFSVAEESPTDPELQSLIGELSIASQLFRTYGLDKTLKQKTSGPALFDTPR